MQSVSWKLVKFCFARGSNSMHSFTGEVQIAKMLPTAIATMAAVLLLTLLLASSEP